MVAPSSSIQRRILMLSAALLSCAPAAVTTAFVVVSPLGGAGLQGQQLSPAQRAGGETARSPLSISSSRSSRRQTPPPATLQWATAPSRPRSVVEDPDGPTPVPESPQPELVDPDGVPELRDVRRQEELPHPIPHQPWRRGDTAGCEAPIAAAWRVAAQAEIRKAVQLVGGRVLDVTWFLTTLLVTLDDRQLPPADIFKDRGPQIDVAAPKMPLFHDPADPHPDPIWADDDEDGAFYERETPEERELRRDRQQNRYVNREDGLDDPGEPHQVDRAGDGDDVDLYRNAESRDEVAALVARELSQAHGDDPRPLDLEHDLTVDTARLSTVAHAILEALEAHEDDWRVLQRHELVLAGPNPARDVLETQRQFDAFRHHPVAVETVDPFESNRTLKGRLADRNAMDVYLNVQGRLVTIPHNFVKCVRLPPGSDFAAASLYKYVNDEDGQENDDDAAAAAAAVQEEDEDLSP